MCPISALELFGLKYMAFFNFISGYYIFSRINTKTDFKDLRRKKNNYFAEQYEDRKNSEAIPTTKY